MTIVWELLEATDPIAWALDPNADPATEDLPGRRVWLPLPGAADAGAVPVVKTDGTGYELLPGGAALFADILVRSDGFDPAVGTFTEVIQVGPLGDEGNRTAVQVRSTLAAVNAIVAVIDTGERWQITASGPCTQLTTPKGGQQVIVGAPSSVGVLTMIGTNNAFITDPDADATALIMDSRSAYNRRCNNFVSALQDEGDAADSIEPDPEGVLCVGGAYDGLPIYREVGHTPGDGGVVTFGGVTFTDPQTVVYLVNQQTAALNGVWELFTDTNGDYGTAGDAYFVRTVIWNSTTDNDPTSPMYCPSGNVFYVADGDNFGLWATSADGLHANATQISTGGGGGVSLGETSTTAYRGDRGKTAYDHSQVTTGNPHGTTAADVGAATSGHNHDGTYSAVGHTHTGSAVGGQDEGAAVANTAGETSLLDSAPTVTATAGEIVKITAGGTYTNDSGSARVPVFRLKLGGTTMLSWSVSVTNSATVRDWHLHATLRVEGNGDVNGSGLLTLHSLDIAPSVGTSAAAIQSGVTVDLTVQHPTATSVQTATLSYVAIERIRATIS